MRLLLGSVAVVAGFLLGALAIAHALPEAPALVTVTIAIAWLFALIFAALSLGSTGELSNGRQDERRLLGYGLLTAILMAAVLIAILTHDRSFPKADAEAILGAIALAVYLLSKYMQPRGKSTPQ